ncbi:MAG: FAD-dependent oxidoreductase [Candidatus Lokiarchaeota archaeon]|nr:FAD-dependent oxidoreductase [Candidatus Lokiarchaeota archaeon]
MVKTYSIAIIGAGPAGTHAAESARIACPSTSIVVISDEQDGFYIREHLNRFLSGTETEDALFEKGRGFDAFKSIGVDLVVDTVTRVDLQGHLLHLAGGGSLGFEQLVIASGAKPRPLGVPGEHLRGVSTFYSIADARHVISLLREPGVKQVVIIGGGTIAFKISPAILAAGKQLAIIERAPRLLPSLLDTGAATIVSRATEARGVRVVLGANIDRFTGVDGAVTGVDVQGTGIIPAQLVIVAAGVSASIQFMKGAPGITLDRGIVVDTSFRANSGGHPPVLAIGDVAQAPDSCHDEQPMLHPSWSFAEESGRHVGSHATGAPGLLPTFMLMTLEVFDLGIISAGRIVDRPGDEVHVRDEGGNVYRKFITCRGKVVGCIMVEPALPRKQARAWLRAAMSSKDGLPYDPSLLSRDVKSLVPVRKGDGS